MEAPICAVCVKSNLLCKACTSRLESGLVSEADVRAARVVEALSESAPSLREVRLRKVLETPSQLLFVVGKGSAGKLVGKGGVVVKQLRETLGKPVRIIEEDQDARLFFQSLLYPVPVLGVNVRYEGGKETVTVQVPKRTLPLTTEAISAIAEQVLGKPVELRAQ